MPYGAWTELSNHVSSSWIRAEMTELCSDNLMVLRTKAFLSPARYRKTRFFTCSVLKEDFPPSTFRQGLKTRGDNGFRRSSSSSSSDTVTYSSSSSIFLKLQVYLFELEVHTNFKFTCSNFKFTNFDFTCSNFKSQTSSSRRIWIYNVQSWSSKLKCKCSNH